MAEVYWNREWELQQLGFQFTYDKRLYDRLRQALPQEVESHLRAEVSFQKKLIRFLENHDEARSATVFGNIRLPAVSTLISTLPGMRLYHQGQLEGKRLRIPVQLRRAKPEAVDEETKNFYDRLLNITNHKLFHDGRWQLLDLQSVGMFLFKISLPICGIIRGFATSWSSISIQVRRKGRILFNKKSEMQISPSQNYVFHDSFTDKIQQHYGEELIDQGLLVSVEPFCAQILAVSILAIT